jgi:protoporphyrinogen oxidase
MKIAIVGGGIMGVSLAYYLSQKGVSVEVFEASAVLGGLAGQVTLQDGTVVDRFYHTILSSDSHLRQMCAELGIEDQLRFNETHMGFYFRGKLFSMNNIVEFLRFPPLNWIDRFQLGLTVLYAQLIHDWHKLEGISVEKWLVQLSGRHTYENIWRPMLRAKFDGSFENTPATYIWSRLVRMKSTRGGASQKEEAGYLTGGYGTLIRSMQARIEASGGRFTLNQPVQEIAIEDNHTVGVRVNGELREFDKVIATVQSPLFRRMIPQASQDYLDFLSKMDYLGIISGLLILDRPLSNYWTLYITEEDIPFTGVIETTTYIDPACVGGYHLVYLPKYTAPSSDWQNRADDEIQEIWLANLERMFPQFDRHWIRYFLIHRERYVEPLHNLNRTDDIPQITTPINNLYLANTSQIYPALTNAESISRFSEQVVSVVMGN